MKTTHRIERLERRTYSSRRHRHWTFCESDDDPGMFWASDGTRKARILTREECEALLSPGDSQVWIEYTAEDAVA